MDSLLKRRNSSASFFSGLEQKQQQQQQQIKQQEYQCVGDQPYSTAAVPSYVNSSEMLVRQFIDPHISKCHSQGVYKICKISNDLLATSSCDNSIKFWNLQGKESQPQLINSISSGSCCRSFCVSQTTNTTTNFNTLFFGTSQNNVFRMQASHLNKQIEAQFTCQEQVYCLAIINQVQLTLAAGDAAGNIYIINGNNMQLIELISSQSPNGHKGSVNALIRLSDTQIASAGGCGQVKIWCTQTGNQLSELLGHSTSKNVYMLLQHPSRAGAIISGSSDKTIRVWDGPTGQQLKKIILTNPIYAGVILNDQELAVGDLNVIRIFNLKTWNYKKIQQHQSRINVIAKYEYNSFLSGDVDGNVIIMEFSNGDNKEELKGDQQKDKILILGSNQQENKENKSSLIKEQIIQQVQQVQQQQLSNYSSLLNTPADSALKNISNQTSQIKNNQSSRDQQQCYYSIKKEDNNQEQSSNQLLSQIRYFQNNQSTQLLAPQQQQSQRLPPTNQLPVAERITHYDVPVNNLQSNIIPSHQRSNSQGHLLSLPHQQDLTVFPVKEFKIGDLSNKNNNINSSNHSTNEQYFNNYTPNLPIVDPSKVDYKEYDTKNSEHDMIWRTHQEEENSFEQLESNDVVGQQHVEDINKVGQKEDNIHSQDVQLSQQRTSQDKLIVSSALPPPSSLSRQSSLSGLNSMKQQQQQQQPIVQNHILKATTHTRSCSAQEFSIFPTQPYRLSGEFSLEKQSNGSINQISEQLSDLNQGQVVQSDINLVNQPYKLPISSSQSLQYQQYSLDIASCKARLEELNSVNEELVNKIRVYQDQQRDSDGVMSDLLSANNALIDTNIQLQQRTINAEANLRENQAETGQKDQRIKELEDKILKLEENENSLKLECSHLLAERNKGFEENHKLREERDRFGQERNRALDELIRIQNEKTEKQLNSGNEDQDFSKVDSNEGRDNQLKLQTLEQQLQSQQSQIQSDQHSLLVQSREILALQRKNEELLKINEQLNSSNDLLVKHNEQLLKQTQQFTVQLSTLSQHLQAKQQQIAQLLETGSEFDSRIEDPSIKRTLRLILEDHDISDIIAMDSEYHEHPGQQGVSKEISKKKQDNQDIGNNGQEGIQEQQNNQGYDIEDNDTKKYCRANEDFQEISKTNGIISQDNIQSGIRTLQTNNNNPAQQQLTEEDEACVRKNLAEKYKKIEIMASLRSAQDEVLSIKCQIEELRLQLGDSVQFSEKYAQLSSSFSQKSRQVSNWRKIYNQIYEKPEMMEI